MNNRIVLSTHNKGKLAEFEGLAKRLGLEIITRDDAGIPHDFDVVEDGTTFEENSYKKAYEVMKMCGLPTMADDSGLMVDALDGQPGVYSSRFGGVEGDAVRNYTKLVITLIYPDGETIVVKGECHGRITEAPIGDLGFGYDPVFMPDGYNETFAQLGPDVKNQFSHRAKALEELERILESR